MVAADVERTRSNHAVPGLWLNLWSVRHLLMSQLVLLWHVELASSDHATLSGHSLQMFTSVGSMTRCSRQDIPPTAGLTQLSPTLLPPSLQQQVRPQALAEQQHTQHDMTGDQQNDEQPLLQGHSILQEVAVTTGNLALRVKQVLMQASAGTARAAPRWHNSS